MPYQPANRQSSLRRLYVLIFLCLCFALVSLTIAYWTRVQNPDMKLTEARQALTRGDCRTAELIVESMLSEGNNSPAVTLLAGDIAAREKKWSRALAYYDRLSDAEADAALKACQASASIRFELGYLFQAERDYRKILELQPGNIVAHRRLSDLLLAEGRLREASEHLLYLLKSHQIDTIDLIMLGNNAEMYEDRDLTERASEIVPSDPLHKLGPARLAILQNRQLDAMPALRQITERYPTLFEAQALLGRGLLELDDVLGFLQWYAALPSGSSQHPEIWVTLGRFAEERGEKQVAVRCFWEAVKLDPNHLLANHRLGQLLISLSQESKAEIFLTRAEKLRDFGQSLRETSKDPSRPEPPLQAAELAESLGRLWESWAWYFVASQLLENDHPIGSKRDQIKASIDFQTDQTLPESNPALIIDFSSYPKPSWDDIDVLAAEPVEAAKSISFIDVSTEARLDFQYVNGWTPAHDGMMIYQNFGGGVAAIDYDLDGWPDLYLTQAHAEHPDQRATAPPDRLFRNTGKRHFQDVTVASGLGDTSFSMGISHGDFNGDGFPDVYVANLGNNRLYRNNGDGTFTDVTKTAGLNASRWTNSCVIADINGDGFADIYDVNYVDGKDALHKVCTDSGRKRSCRPTQFESEIDQLFLNSGNGTFEDISSVSGIDVRGGKGLGILVFDADSSGLPELFIANDMTPNFFFVNQTKNANNTPYFQDEAVLRGVAVDEAGQNQACMGIAAGDATGNLLIDLFVTNFYNESNTFYEQSSEMLFSDFTRQRNLRDPGFRMLGFGTQFLDADLDGWLDLVVANGHVDDYSFDGIPFQMPPQFFWNRGQGSFQVLMAEQLGTYFERKALGRSMVRLDWNRDGRPDFAVSHLDAKAALLENKTEQFGHFITIELHGTFSNRDAVGTRVTVKSKNNTYRQQLMAGDGYQASNQRQLIFGLGVWADSLEIQVEWPSGKRQLFEDLPVDSAWKIIESDNQPYSLPVWAQRR